MSEENLDSGVIPAVEVVKTEPVVSEEIKSSEPAEEIKSEPAERTFTQTELNAHIAAEKRRVADKMQRQFSAQQQATQSNAVEEEPQMYTQSQIDARIDQREALRKQSEWAMGIGQRVEQKVQQARISDPEFGEAYEELNIEHNPYLAVHLDKVENTTDVMKELRNHPDKYANILMLLAKSSPVMVDSAILKISKSIEENKKAINQKKANPPLDQVKPSNFDTGKSGGPASDVKNYLLKRRR